MLVLVLYHPLPRTLPALAGVHQAALYASATLALLSRTGRDRASTEVEWRCRRRAVLSLSRYRNLPALPCANERAGKARAERAALPPSGVRHPRISAGPREIGRETVACKRRPQAGRVGGQGVEQPANGEAA